MKKVFLLALAAIAAGGASATITEQHVYGGSLFGDATQTRLDAGYVNPYFKQLKPAANQVTLTLTNTPSGWKHTAWLSHAGSSTSADRIAAHYTETDFVNPLPYEWHSQTDQNAWRAIVARFDPIKVTFKFDTAGGPAKNDIVANLSTNYVNLSSYNGTRTGYSFECWKDAAGNPIPGYTAGKNLALNLFGRGTTNLLTRWFAAADGSARQMPGNLPFGVIGNADTNIWLYASWTGNVYKVQMDPNGGAFTSNGATSPRQRSVTFGQAYGPLPGVSFTGKTLKGWYTAATGGTLVTGDTLVSTPSDHTIYAQWSTKPVVTFYYVNANNETVFEEQYVDYGGTAVPPSRETVNQCPGKVFTGWDRSYANVTESIQVHAQYTVNSYNVVYLPNCNDATGTMVDDHYACYVAWNLRANQFVRSGYTFAGWNTEPDGTGSSYSDGQQVSNLTYDNGGTVTLYAQWSPISYTIAFSGGSGAEGEMAAIPAVYDQAVVLPANAFTKTGCAFLQWAFGTTNFLDGATVSNLTTTAGATVTLTAVWDAPY
ncbi:MAG: InlB B-repeat-containing protein, partial [Kiritimatiellae bacterium]|nr:InlB B-repeat-containing protein [Kiritimatiellia bacterium]